jgi:hypothetical protein
VPIKVRSGIFHPKVAVMSDDEGNVRASVGSGNLTFGGWGYNSEILDVLLPGRDSICFGELAELWSFSIRIPRAISALMSNGLRASTKHRFVPKSSERTGHRQLPFPAYPFAAA